ncbi:phage tail domain-containing protein [Lacticaseibacillus paracasei]|uniref:phage tail domain-containing protein n=1 Tax=Lacticaseibacillus paracasei TaxID=1597 RepID=UPI000D70809D|nr:phage tail domain-containing protein [Lacticaseibacillus paracasei]AWN84593.1 hypothetical protein LPEG9_11730 [Lacticaseibacillus paracasei]
MDLLVEKLDGSRYYLSQYKVLITGFEESAPSITRNSKQLDQRNGNIDFGGWHTDKTINITGYYRADDMDEEETLREKLYALLSDPDGYYITQLKTTPSVAMERPGETSGGYYDRLRDYPSHKRFLVYTESPEMELVGNVNGTLLYKLTAEFKTLSLPYGESLPKDVQIEDPYRNIPINLLKGATATPISVTGSGWNNKLVGRFTPTTGNKYTVTVLIGQADFTVSLQAWANDANGNRVTLPGFPVTTQLGHDQRGSITFTWPDVGATGATQVEVDLAWAFNKTEVGTYQYMKAKAELGTAYSDWSPNPTDPEYFGLNGNLIPYSGTVPNIQIEQGFSVEYTAKDNASGLSFAINDANLTLNNAIKAGDVFVFNGFSYTQNGLSIVDKTNKAYFVLQPDVQNEITCTVPGTVRIIGLKNLYA